MSTKSETLIVSGYIRELKELLADSTIIPIDIIELCCLFYRPLLTILISKTFTNCIYKLDIQLKKRIKLFDKKSVNNSQSHNLFCYIQDLSVNNKLYDAIIGIDDIKMNTNSLNSSLFENTCYYPSLLLLHPHQYNMNDDVIYYDKYRSIRKIEDYTPPFDRIHQLLYCGETNGVLYERDGNLYQSKLHNIDIDKKDFGFDSIKSNEYWDFKYDLFNPKCLSMSYIRDINKIFAIKSEWSLYSYDLSTNKAAKCGMFDFETSEWKYIAGFEYNYDALNSRYYKHISCYNQFDPNLMYVVSTQCSAMKYDFNKNIWIHIIDDCLKPIDNKPHIVWMDDINTLCYSNGKYFGSLDVRNKEKWIQLKDITDIAISNDEDIDSGRVVFL